MPVPATTCVPSASSATTGGRRASSIRRPLVALGLVSSLGLVAIGCGSSTTSPSTTSPSSTGTSAPATSAATTGSSTAPGSTVAGTGSRAKVSANSASTAEIQAALTAAGVTNAARWTKEIEEYRPYPTDDPKLAKLRKELAKYNPSADQLEKILGALEP